MRKLAIAVALASTALATPAVARDHSFYAGLEGGVMWVEDMDLDYHNSSTGLDLKDAITLTHDSGLDVDVIAGYDFGMLRLEGELAYKRASINQAITQVLLSGGSAGDAFDSTGRARATSAMLNLLIDAGNEDALSGYAGVGVGVANVKYNPSFTTPNGTIEFSDSYNGMAWQGIIGLRYAVSPN